MVCIEDIKAALINGNINSFKLFKEAHDSSIIADLINSVDGKTMIAQIKSYTNNITQETSPNISFNMFKEFENTGNRLIFESAYFKRRKQLFSLVITYILEKNKKYIPLIEDRLWEWCDLYSWELPAHYSMKTPNINKEKEEPDKTVALFAAETAFFFAEILSIIGEDLDAFLVYRLKKEIFRRVINPYKINNYFWETAKMNWSSVCAGSVGAAAIYLIDDVDELALILERVLKSMDAFIEAFDKDGLITEGLGYWSYGFSFYVHFSELLKERTAGKISLLSESDKIKKIAQIPQILQYPTGDFVSFSDSVSGKWWGDCGLFSKLQETLGIEGYNYANSLDIYSDNTYRWASMIRKLLWSTPSKEPSCKSIKTGNFYFSESQWLIDRRNINGRFTAFAAKGGNNDEPHNHNDLGNFILNHMGEDIFVDIGCPEYVKEYFIGETRYDFLAASSLGHSVPLINNNAQSFGKDYYAQILKYQELDSKTYYALDLKNAYHCEELIRYEREFIWNHENLELEIKDKFRFSKDNNEIKEVFISRIKPQIIENGKLIISNNNFRAELLYDDKLECIIEECLYNDHSGKESLVYRTMFIENVDKSKDYTFKIKLV